MVIVSPASPGGELYFADAHPSFKVLDAHADGLMPAYDFQTPADRPLAFVDATTYTGDPTVMTHQSTRQWIHSLSTIFGSLIASTQPMAFAQERISGSQQMVPQVLKTKSKGPGVSRGASSTVP